MLRRGAIAVGTTAAVVACLNKNGIAKIDWKGIHVVNDGNEVKLNFNGVEVKSENKVVKVGWNGISVQNRDHDKELFLKITDAFKKFATVESVAEETNLKDTPAPSIVTENGKAWISGPSGSKCTVLEEGGFKRITVAYQKCSGFFNPVCLSNKSESTVPKDTKIYLSPACGKSQKGL